MTMLMNLHPQYITDEDGNKISVILPIEEFESIIKDDNKVEQIWEDESIKRADAYKKGNIETVSTEEFFSYEY